MPPTTGPTSAETARQMAARVRLDEALAALEVSARELRARQEVLAGTVKERTDDTRATVEGLLDPTATHCRDARAAFDAHDERTDQAVRAAEPATTPRT